MLYGLKNEATYSGHGRLSSQHCPSEHYRGLTRRSAIVSKTISHHGQDHALAGPWIISLMMAGRPENAPCDLDITGDTEYVQLQCGWEMFNGRFPRHVEWAQSIVSIDGLLNWRERLVGASKA